MFFRISALIVLMFLLIVGFASVVWGEGNRLFAHTLGNSNPQSVAWFGFSVEGLGDLNGDGVSDLAVSAPQQTIDGIAQQGKVVVFSGRDETELLTITSPFPQMQANFGEVIAVSDVNDDGIPDLVIGVRLQDVDEKVDQGEVYIFSGVDGSWLSTIEAPLPQAAGFFGASVSTLNDRGNQNGRAEIIVGSPQQSFDNSDNEGAVFLLSAMTGELLSIVLHPDPQAGASFGFAVEEVGDLDGDAVPDFIVSAPFQMVAGRVMQGQVYAFSGGSALFGQDPKHLYTLNFPDPDMPTARFGFAVASSDDLNGDGVSDFVVGAPTADFDHISNQGSAFVFSGADGLLLHILRDPSTDATVLQDAFFGAALASLGDIDGDGVADIAVGAPAPVSRGDNVLNHGRVLLFSGVNGEHLLTLDNLAPEAGGSFGFSLSAVGDVTGDSMPDLLTGAPFHNIESGGQSHLASGEAFLISGLGPDLKGKIVEAVRTVTASGHDRVSFEVKIKNRGTVRTPIPFKVKVHISNDDVFDGGRLDPRVAKWKVEQSLSPGESITLTGSADFEEAVGGMFLLIRVDPKNNIVEKREGNNVKAFRILG